MDMNVTLTVKFDETVINLLSMFAGGTVTMAFGDEPKPTKTEPVKVDKPKAKAKAEAKAEPVKAEPAKAEPAKEEKAEFEPVTAEETETLRARLSQMKAEGKNVSELISNATGTSGKKFSQLAPGEMRMLYDQIMPF